MLRIHATQEWHDLYQKSTSDELQEFFDRYLKDIPNDFETKTPRVRVSLLGYNTVQYSVTLVYAVADHEKPNIVNHPFSTWPVPATSHQRLYLTGDEHLVLTAPSGLSTVMYQADTPAMQADDDAGELWFRYTFSKTAYFLGSVKAVLTMSCADSDDMDIFLQIRKLDATGKILRYHNIPEEDMSAQGVPVEELPLINPTVYLGPHGQIRASHRAVDHDLSKPHYIQHRHDLEERITPGTSVKIETSIWPGGIIFNEGESMVFKISGHPMYLSEFPTLRGQFLARNTGRHVVHIGGSTASYIEVPFVEL